MQVQINEAASCGLLRPLLNAPMHLAWTLCLCIAAQRMRSTWGSQGQLPRKTEHEHSRCGLRVVMH